jgi:acetylornithine/succinyldiaminopimelate/putrescine aminotransferase
VVPDLLVLAKALGGGLPLGAFVGRPAVMATLADDPPLAHVTTFGGHPLSCAAGLAALEILVRDRLARSGRRCSGIGCSAASPPSSGAEGSPRCAGAGCSSGSSSSLPRRAPDFVQRAQARGLILNWTLHRDTVVRLAPPLVLSDAEAERALADIAAALG